MASATSVSVWEYTAAASLHSNQEAKKALWSQTLRRDLNLVLSSDVMDGRRCNLHD